MSSRLQFASRSLNLIAASGVPSAARTWGLAAGEATYVGQTEDKNEDVVSRLASTACGNSFVAFVHILGHVEGRLTSRDTTGLDSSAVARGERCTAVHRGSSEPGFLFDTLRICDALHRRESARAFGRSRTADA